MRAICGISTSARPVKAIIGRRRLPARCPPIGTTERGFHRSASPVRREDHGDGFRPSCASMWDAAFQSHGDGLAEHCLVRASAWTSPTGAALACRLPVASTASDARRRLVGWCCCWLETVAPLRGGLTVTHATGSLPVVLASGPIRSLTRALSVPPSPLGALAHPTTSSTPAQQLLCYCSRVAPAP